VPNPNETHAVNRPSAPAPDDGTRVQDTYAGAPSADRAPVVTGYDIECEIARGGTGAV
jgi:hypothetical protein